MRALARARQRCPPIALLAAAALVMSACGGGGDTTSVATTSTHSTSTTTRASGGGSPTTTSTTSTSRSTSTTTTTSTDTSTTSDLQAEFDDAVRKTLKRQGIKPSQINCVIEKLNKTVSQADIEAVASSGEIPDSVSKAAFNAAFQCTG